MIQDLRKIMIKRTAKDAKERQRGLGGFPHERLPHKGIRVSESSCVSPVIVNLQLLFPAFFCADIIFCDQLNWN
jgi:hypothetical protein